MNISEVKVKLLGSDILSIINEFVKIDGLTLKSIKINNSLIVEGNFKSGISIDFLVKAELIDCINNKIHHKPIKSLSLKNPLKLITKPCMNSPNNWHIRLLSNP